MQANHAAGCDRVVMSVLKTLILCIAACLTVRCTRWYYRIGQGPVFGPYNEGLLRQWRTDGYFNDANIYVSHEDSPERFLPFETSIRGSLNTRTTKFVKDKMRKLFKSANRRFAPVVASSDIAWPGGNRAQTGAQNQGSESDQHFEIGPETDTGKPTEHVAAPLDIAAVVSEERAMQVPSGMSTEAAAIHPDGGEVLDVDETVLLSQLKRDATPKPDRQSSSVEVVHNEPQQQPQQFSLRGLGNHESSAWEPRHVKHNGVLHPSSVDDEKLPLFQGAVQEAAATSVVVLKRMVRLIAMIFPPVLQQAASHIVGLGSRPGGVSVLLLLLVYGAVQVIRAALNLSLLATVYAVVISMVPSSTRQTSIVKLSNYVNDAHIHTAELGAVPASLQSTRPLLTDLTKQVLESVRKALQLLRSVNSGSVPSRKGVISGCRDVSRLVYASAVQHWATLRPQLCALGSRPVQLALVLSLLAVLNVVILPRLNAAITARVQPTGVSNEATSDAGAAIVYVRLSAGLAFSLTATAAFVWHLLGSVNDARLPAMQWIALPLSVATVLSTIESYGAQAPRYNRDQRQSMERGAEEHDLDERKALRRVRDRMLDVEALVKILSRPDALLECEASELSTYASDFVRHAASRLQQAMHKLTAAANSDRLDSPVVRTRFATVRRVVLSALVAVISLLVWSRSDVHHAGGQALWSFMAKRIGSNPLYRACVPRVWNALDATSRMLRDGVCGPLATDPVLIAASPVHAVGTELLLPGIVLVAPTWLLQRHLGVLATLELDTAQSDRGVASRERSQATFAASHLRRVESALQAAMAIAERLCRPHLPSQSEASPAGSTRNGGVELRLSLDNEKMRVLRLPAGQVTLVLCSSLQELTKVTATISPLVGLADVVRRPSGCSLSVHGRTVGDYEARELRRAVALFSGEEPELPFHAGAVAGYLPGMRGAELRRALRAQVASGAHHIIAALAQGPATLLSTLDSVAEGDADGTARTLLTSDQWRRLHLSRALSLSHRDILLLVDPARDMSPAQRKLFFQFLREELRPEQVVAIVSAETSLAECVDRVMRVSGEEPVRHGDETPH